ncbi:unnamed protein product [Linum trigynum]|uniref:RNase H type-1 domain-containing protein n=1 Tax=Linum trigynum TaxID=586398 RepID=A0AAV2CKN0_9ROSI
MEGRAYFQASIIQRIRSWLKIYEQAMVNEQSISASTLRHRENKQISWRPPEEGWIQIQTDGSVISPTSKAVAGGLLRAFVCNLGACSITDAELKGAAEGLSLAWLMGFKKILLNLDSMTAISIINSGEDDHRHNLLANHIRELIDREWEVKVPHVYRESNFAADYLACIGHDFPFGTHPVDVSDPKLCSWLSYDVMGITHDRFVSMN